MIADVAAARPRRPKKIQSCRVCVAPGLVRSDRRRVRSGSGRKRASRTPEGERRARSCARACAFERDGQSLVRCVDVIMLARRRQFAVYGAAHLELARRGRRRLRGKASAQRCVLSKRSAQRCLSDKASAQPLATGFGAGSPDSMT
jgi:hypothetical protein